MQSFPQTETNFILQGPAGHLEVLTSPAKENTLAKDDISIICHPHSLFGGTMTNKIVSTLARAYAELGLRTVRFNFRGVGKSTGEFAEGEGEQEDLFAIVDWVKKVSPQSKICLAGFSFGAAVSAHVATQISIAQLISIAPPVPRFNLLNLKPITCPWLIVQGEQDDVVDPQAVYEWVETRNPKPTFIRMPQAGHFFHGQLLGLREIVEGWAGDFIV
jgi:alpha/beta superfamily hydrolase